MKFTLRLDYYCTKLGCGIPRTETEWKPLVANSKESAIEVARVIFESKYTVNTDHFVTSAALMYSNVENDPRYPESTWMYFFKFPDKIALALECDGSIPEHILCRL
jgi:hypothetical protein